MSAALEVDPRPSRMAMASIEVSSRGNQTAELRERFAPGTEVMITWLPGDDYHRTVETSIALRKAGLNPVPHISARELASLAALEDLLVRVRGEADVTRVLLISGDLLRPNGPFHSSLDLCRSGMIEAHGIERVSIAGYPEGHPYLDETEALNGIAARRDWGRGVGVEVDLVSQFCFASALVLEWMQTLQARGLDLPVTIGLAGPASPATLLKFALRCGIGNSLKALRTHIGRFGRLLADEGPDEVVHDLQAAPASTTRALRGFHVFPFGGLRKTSEWLSANPGAANVETAGARGMIAGH